MFVLKFLEYAISSNVWNIGQHNFGEIFYHAFLAWHSCPPPLFQVEKLPVTWKGWVCTGYEKGRVLSYCMSWLWLCHDWKDFETTLALPWWDSRFHTSFVFGLKVKVTLSQV